MAPTRSSAVAFVVLALLSGCGDDELTGVVIARPAAGSPCPSEHGEKLGVPFVRVCGGGGDAYWIGAALLPCSAGEHETVECPIATPLVADPPLPVAMRPRAVMLVEMAVAYRTCALRFGGRLPTTDELDRARRVQGLATLVASDTADGATRLADLREWTADGTCTNPSLPGPTCIFARHPPAGGSASFDWATLRSCTVTPADPEARGLLALGDTCRHGGADCMLASPLVSPGAAPRALVVHCASLEAPSVHPAARPDVAGARCVLPRDALTPSP